MNYDEICTSHLRCTSNICPLDPDIKVRNFIQGEPICSKVLDFLEGTDTGFDDAIQKSEHTWRKKWGSVLDAKVQGRISLRQYWNNRKKGVPDDVCNAT